jgi:adenylate cyclase
VNPRQLDGRRRTTARSKPALDAAVLLEVSNKLAAISSLDEQLELLVATLVGMTNAERGSLFLNDPATNELYSRVALGNHRREIRIPNDSGVAGHVFTTGKGAIIREAYSDERFNKTIDEVTGFRTKSLLCAPVRTVRGEVIGVAQCHNKRKGRFSEVDLAALEAMTMQAAVVLQGTLFILRTERLRQREADFLSIVSEVSSEIQLGPLLEKIMSAVTRMLSADRSTLFLNDEKTNELYTEIGQGLGATQIRLPNKAGIAGAVFTSGKSVNIPYAYADLRFNPDFDKRTGYFTRSILCVPVQNKDGKMIGVTQVLNKQGGPFTDEDEAHLKAFTAQISIGLENAKLFDDVQKMKNYNESMLESMSNGVLTFDDDGSIVTCNAAAQRMIASQNGEVVGRRAEEVFGEPNGWVLDRIRRVDETQMSDLTMDAELRFGESTHSVNLTLLPLTSGNEKKLGSMMLIEDISTEKRVKATMARYMDPSLADQLLGSGDKVLGGQSQEGTVLFSDVRDFAGLTEELGAQGTVSLLNEYFTVMVDCISREGGMLDKFIGDAIMAVFGVPIARDDDGDRAVRTAIAMHRELTVFNEGRKERGQKPIEIGVGISTDTIVSGNIGSPKRMDYTVIGDGVNLASRLESACKQYRTKILISEFTLRKLRGTYRTREVDRVIVKGKTAPVGVYEVLDFHDERSFPNLMEVMHRFRDGLSLYRESRWDDALSAFEAALRYNPNDTAARLYVQRCQHLKENPPPENWDGVWVMTSK